MGDAFPTTGIFRRGYGKDAVDEFFIDARHAYEGGLPAEQFSAEQVRQASFPRQRNGYDTQAVDAAMSRLEAAFVQRDRADHIARRHCIRVCSAPTDSVFHIPVRELATTLNRLMTFWIRLQLSLMIVRIWLLTMSGIRFSRPRAVKKPMQWVRSMPILGAPLKSFFQ